MENNTDQACRWRLRTSILTLIHLMAWGILFLLSSVDAAYAAPERKFPGPAEKSLPKPPYTEPKFRFQTRLETHFLYEDNFYKTENEPEAVSTLVLRPGIRAGYYTAKTRIDLAYHLSSHRYGNLSCAPSAYQAAPVDDYIGHEAELAARYEPSQRLVFGVNEAYTLTRDPRDIDNYGDSTDRYRYFINRVSPYAGYAVGKRLFIQGNVEHTIIDYDLSGLEDATSMLESLLVSFRMSSRSTCGLRLSLWQRDYETDTSDYASREGSFFYSLQLNHLLLESALGYHRRHFEKPDLENMGIVSYRLKAEVQDPPFPDPLPRHHILFLAQRNINNFGPGDDYYTSSLFTLDIRKRFHEKILTSIRAVYRIVEYERAAEREDDIYDISLGLGYRIFPWIETELTAGFKKRDSYDSSYLFENTYCLFSIHLKKGSKTK